MRFPLLLAYLAHVFLAGAAALPLAADDLAVVQSNAIAHRCINPAVRVDFTSLSRRQQTTYFDAINCLTNLPPNPETAWPHSQSRWEDLVATHYYHANLTGGTDSWHHVGQFLHIHRAYMFALETMLRTECSYTGPMSYWPEQRDASVFATSEVVVAHGGPGPGIITTGPFANMKAAYGPLPNTNAESTSIPPSLQNLEHTLWRNVTESWSALANETYLDSVMEISEFGAFKTLLYSSIHTAGHFGTGGDMGHPMAAPNDPLFFMHHMYLDGRWWQWQQANPKSRTYAIPTPGPGMFTTMDGTTPMTLLTTLDTSGLLPNLTVADVADTRGGTLCYVYEGLSRVPGLEAAAGW